MNNAELFLTMVLNSEQFRSNLDSADPTTIGDALDYVGISLPSSFRSALIQAIVDQKTTAGWVKLDEMRKALLEVPNGGSN